MNEHLINLIFGLLIVLGVIVVVVAKTFRVAERIREQADRIEAAARRIEAANANQSVINHTFDRRIDAIKDRGHSG